SVLTNFTLVCDSNRGFGNLMLKTQTNPSRTSSPDIDGSFSFGRLFERAYLLIAFVSAVRKPVRCVPPSGFGMELAKQRIWSLKLSLYCKTTSTTTSPPTSEFTS